MCTFLLNYYVLHLTSHPNGFKWKTVTLLTCPLNIIVFHLHMLRKQLLVLAVPSFSIILAQKRIQLGVYKILLIIDIILQKMTVCGCWYVGPLHLVIHLSYDVLTQCWCVFWLVYRLYVALASVCYPCHHCVPKAVLFGTDCFPPDFLLFFIYFIFFLVFFFLPTFGYSIACIRPDMPCQWVSGVMGGWTLSSDLERSRSQGQVQGHTTKLLAMPRKAIWVPPMSNIFIF